MQESEREKVRELVSGQVEEVLSCLASGSNKLAASMKRAMLEVSGILSCLTSGSNKLATSMKRAMLEVRGFSPV